MSEKIVQLNEEVIKGQIKELVRGSVEETLNELLEQEAEKLTQAARYERNEARVGAVADLRAGHEGQNVLHTLLSVIDRHDLLVHLLKLDGDILPEPAQTDQQNRFHGNSSHLLFRPRPPFYGGLFAGAGPGPPWHAALSKAGTAAFCRVFVLLSYKIPHKEGVKGRARHIKVL